MKPTKFSACVFDDAVVETFKQLAEALDYDARELLGAIVEKIVYEERRMRTHGLPGFALFAETGADPIEPLATYAFDVIPISVKPTAQLWPANVPFYWTETQCKAAIMGYRVRWPGSIEEFLNHAPGRWDLDESGFISMRRSQR